jgi:acylglycerol lipase
MSAPFSLRELSQAGPGEVAPVRNCKASDGIEIAYRVYLRDRPIAALVFYHGGGAHSGAGYAHLAAGLRDHSGVAVYTPDIRGHGDSGGERGDAPSAEQLFRDVDALIHLARDAHPDRPLFVGGHSSGAGLALNYATWESRSPADGYVFLSPQLGFRSKTERKTSDGFTPFAKARIAPFIINAITGGRLMGHHRAVQFDYPPEALAADPRIVVSNTVNLANGITPRAPHDQFAQLQYPFGLWVGADDELFDPNKVIEFGHLNTQVPDGCVSAVVADRNHLGILVSAHEFIGPWLTQRIQSIQ